MWKFKEQADDHDRLTNMTRVKKELEALPERMPGLILDLGVGLNALDDGANFDMVLVADFEDLEALDRYLKHPEHEKVAELVMKVREQRAAVDFELKPRHRGDACEEEGPGDGPAEGHALRGP